MALYLLFYVLEYKLRIKADRHEKTVKRLALLTNNSIAKTGKPFKKDGIQQYVLLLQMASGLVQTRICLFGHNALMGSVMDGYSMCEFPFANMCRNIRQRKRYYYQ